MEWRKVNAVFRSSKLKQVEERLQELGVSGVTINRVRGCGEDADFFSKDWCSTTHARIEVFNTASRAEEIAEGIMDAAHTGAAGDGIVAIVPVERIYRIRTKAEVDPGDI